VSPQGNPIFEFLNKLYKRMSTKLILREIAELTNSMPADVDPEDIAPDFLPSESEEEDNHDAGREQYIEVRYKLSTPESQLLTPK
jgi:hypothetical protein